MNPAIDKAAARAAFSHADALERELLSRYPHAWRQLDHFRDGPPVPAPDWCLLPMAGCVAVTTGGAPTHQIDPLRPPPIAQMAALYAWRHSRAVYLVEPALQQRLLSTIPDSLALEDFTGLPSWCVYIPSTHPEFPGAGLWVHLEHDAYTGRPELRLLLDHGEGIDTMTPIPIYLDRPSITEALGDFRATAQAARTRLHDPNRNRDVRGGALDVNTAALADRVDGLLAVVAYLCRPEADIVEASRPGVRPGPRRRRLARDRQIWVVGYTVTQ